MDNSVRTLNNWDLQLVTGTPQPHRHRQLLLSINMSFDSFFMFRKLGGTVSHGLSVFDNGKSSKWYIFIQKCKLKIVMNNTLLKNCPQLDWKLYFGAFLQAPMVEKVVGPFHSPQPVPPYWQPHTCIKGNHSKGTNIQYSHCYFKSYDITIIMTKNFYVYSFSATTSLS